MRKACCCIAAVILLLSNTAMADSLAGRMGLTLHGGFRIAADNDFSGVLTGPTIDSDTGYVVGGGLIFGLNENVASEIEILYSQNDMNVSGVKFGEAKTVDLSFGLQYRFNPRMQVVPYVGAGMNVIFPDITIEPGYFLETHTDTDASFGGHLKAGVDFFIAPNLAFTGELQGTLATKVDVKQEGEIGLTYNPSNFSGLFGVRFIF